MTFLKKKAIYPIILTILLVISASVSGCCVLFMPTTAAQELKPYSILFIDLNMDDPLLGLPIFGNSGTDVKVFLSLNITPDNASVCPMILDSANYEKFMKGESYEKWRYDGNTSIGEGLSDVFTINSKEKYYIALFNKEMYPVNFTITLSPTI